MGIGRENKRTKRQALKNQYAIRDHLRQQAIYENLLEIPGACYYVPNLRKVAEKVL